MTKWSGVNVASLSLQILLIPTQDKIPPSLRNQPPSLGPIFESESKVHSGMVWTPSFLNPDPNLNSPLAPLPQSISMCRQFHYPPVYPPIVPVHPAEGPLLLDRDTREE